VTDHVSGERRAVPAQMIFLRRFPAEIQLRREHLSSGAALGERGGERALSSGIFELVERDAAIAAWLTRTPLPRIVDLPSSAPDLPAYLRRYRLEPYIFDARSDLGIPTAVAITIDETGIGPAVNAGIRAAFTYEEAITGALLESIQARRGLRLAEAPDRFPDEDEVTSPEQRFYFWQPPERIRLLRFWLETDRKFNYASLCAEPLTLEGITGRLREKGYHILAADITLPEIARAGFEVVKVVIPELHTMYLDERARTHYSVRHGLIGAGPSPAPHPFV
jgi:ribosomal protein S12 methylthiotransferase accessory factor